MFLRLLPHWANERFPSHWSLFYHPSSPLAKVLTIALRLVPEVTRAPPNPAMEFKLPAKNPKTTTQHPLSRPFLVLIGTGWVLQEADSETELKFKGFNMESRGITPRGSREMRQDRAEAEVTL